MSTEPDTRPFTSAELAHFLEQLELDRTPPRCSVIEARPPRVVVSEPATMLGMGALAPFAAPRPRAVSRTAPADSYAAAIPAATAQPAAVARAPRNLPDPFAVTEAAAPSRGLLRGRAWLALGALLLSGVAACLLSMPSRARLAHAAHRGPPPLPALPAPSPGPWAPGATVAESPAPLAARSAAEEPRHSVGDTSARAGLAQLAAARQPDSVSASAAREQTTAVSTERVDMHEPRDDATWQLADAQQVPVSRPAARREAVDLLLAGRTRAALSAYRALPRAWRTEPALAQLVRQLERELRECGQQAETPCGS